MSQPKPMQPARLALAVSAALSLSATQTLAAERAGEVLSSAGPVIARSGDGSARSLSRGQAVYPGDVIKTNRGRAQIRFADGALVSLDPRTRFAVEQYSGSDDAGGGGDNGGGSAVMRLFRGAMRTITGAIGDDPEEEYRMETPVATVGIRGTQYALHYCDSDSCGSDVDEGLYGHVTGDAITVENEAGRARFSSGRYFKVADNNTAPQALVAPPGDLFRGDSEPSGSGDADRDEGDDLPGTDDDAVPRAGAGGEADDATPSATFSQADSTGVAASAPLLTDTAVAAGVVGETSLGDTFSKGGVCISDAQCSAEVGANGTLQQVASIGTLNSADAGSGVTLAESGTVGSLDATWGRWNGDITVNDGADTITGNFPWAFSTNPTTEAQFSSQSGSLTYGQVSGPSPGADDGTDWTVVSLSIGVDFNTPKVTDADLALSSPTSSITLNTIDTASIDGDPVGLNVELSKSGDDGSLSGLFVGDDADGIILEFEATDGSTQIRGVKILEPSS